MASIPVPGLSISDIEGADTTPKAGGSTWFPATTTGYSRFTGIIEKAEVKVIGDDESLSFVVTNGTCKQEVLVSIEPNKTNPQSQVEQEKQIQNNLDALRAALKLSGCYDAKGCVDVGKLKEGRIMAFDAKLTKWREYNGAQYPQIRAYFKGEARELVPVTPLDLDAARKSAGAATRPAPSQAQAALDDLPF